MAIGTSQAFRAQNLRLLGNFYDKNNYVGAKGYYLNSVGNGTEWRADINEGTGILSGGVISATIGGTTFNITAGTGQILSYALIGGEVITTNTRVSWNAQNNIALTYRTSHQFSYIYIDENGVLQQQNSSFTDAEYRNKIIIGVICHIDYSTINLVTNKQNVAYHDATRIYELISCFGPIKQSGLSVSAYSTDLRISRASGTAFLLGTNYATNQFVPDTIDLNSASPALICRVYQNGSGNFIFDVNSGSYYTSIDPTKYDDGSGTLATVNNNQWSIQRLYFFPNNPNDVIVYYGRAVYNSYGDAIGSISTESFSEATITTENAIFLGYLVLRGGAANLSTSADAVFFQSGAFRNIGVGGGGGGGAGATTLDDLSDVAISSPSDSQFLIYDNGTSLWKNASLTASSPITFTGVGTTLTLSVSNNAINFNKIQQIATSRVLGRITAGTGDIEELTGANIATIIGSNTITNATNATNTAITDDVATNASMYLTWVTAASGNLPQKVSSTKLTFNPSSGTLVAGVFSGSGASLTSLPAGQLTGTIPSTVLGNSTVYIGTTAILLNRASASQSLTGITSIDGSAATLTTSRTLWGQSFNGSANVTGSLTSVGDITGSSAITITAGGSNQNITVTPSGTGYTLLNGNVGIGVATPTQKLHVVGSSIISNSSPSPYVALIKDDGVDTPVKLGTVLRVVNDGSSSAYSVFEASSSVSDFVILNSGQVGIGTTSPATTLQIGQLTPTSATAGLQFGDDTGTRIYRSASNTLTMGGTFIATTFSGSGASLTSLNASNLSSGTVPGDRGVTAGSATVSFVEYNGTTATAGQFDGGTTNPSATTRLNYGGYLYATRFYGDGSNLTGVTGSSFGSQTANTFFAAPNGTAGNPTFRAIVAADVPTLNQNTTGSAATLTTSRTLWGQSFNGSANVTGSLTSVGDITGSSAITITAGGSNQNITVTPSGTGYTLLNGNVGIGTTIPSYKLHATGAFNFDISGSLHFRSYSFGTDLIVDQVSVGGWARGNRIYNSNYTAGTSFFGVLGSESAVSYAYWTLDNPASVDATGYNSTKGIFLHPTGNVMIGSTSTPANKLSVIGAANIGSASYNTAGPTNGLIVEGNVGIGTTSPSTKLHVFSTTNNEVTLQTSGTAVSATNRLIFKNASGASDTRSGTIEWYDVNTFKGDIRLLKAGGIQIRNSADSLTVSIDDSGNLGIGTATPSQKLEVQGNIKLGADNSGSYIYYVKDNEGTIVRTTRSDVSQEGLLRSDGWGNFTFNKSIAVGYSLGSGPLTGNIYASGSIGIGTTSPSNTLDVNGTTRIRSISASGSAGTIFLTTDANGVIVSRTAAQVRSDIGAGTGNGTVTSITLATGTTGADVNVSNGTITTSGTITLNIPDASASARGLITTGTQTIAGAKTFSDYLAIGKDIAIPISTTAAYTGYSSNPAGGPTSFLELIESLSNAIGVNDPLRFRTITGQEKYSAGSWSADSVPPTYSNLIDGNASSQLNIISFTDYDTSGITARRFTINLGSQYRRPNFITIQSDYGNNAFYGYSVLIEKSTDNSTWTTACSTQTVSNNTARLLAFSLGDLGAVQYLRFTFTATQAINSGGALKINRIRSYGNQYYSSVIPVYTDNTGSLYSIYSNYLATTSGNVGIGLTNPNNKLTVIGAASIGSATYNTAAPTNGLIIEGGVAIGVTSLIASSKVTIAADQAVYNNDAGQLVLAGSTSTAKRLILGYNTTADKGFIQATNTSSNYTDLLLNPNGANVGIGTTTPGHKLHVVGTAANLARFQSTSASGPYVLFENASVIFGDIGSQLAISGTGSASNMFINARSTGSLMLGTGDAARFTIDSSGNAGIGTISPASLLHVQSSATTTLLRIDNTNSSNDAAILLTDSTNPTGEGLRITYDSSVGDTYFNNIFTASTNAFNFQKGDFGAGTSLMVIQNGGNVGIGTTSPATTLQIGQLTPTSATAGLQFGDDTGTRIYRTGSGTLTMGGTFIATTFSGSGASLTNLPAGQLSGTIPSAVLGNSTVYIGTTAILLNRASASQSLTGITSIDGSAATLTTSRTLWGQSFNGSANVTGSLTSVGDITGSSAITITAGGSNQNVTITPSGTGYTLLNGNVGIKTVSPNVALDVNGIISGKNYSIVDTSNTAQWVKIGRFYASQASSENGRTIKIKAYLHQGYNASSDQDFCVEIFFKTSNNSSVNGNGFAANSWYYSYGNNTFDVTPKWVGNAAGLSATYFDLYLNLPTYTLGSHYQVSLYGDSTNVYWLNSQATGQTDPGSGSSTVLVAENRYNLTIGNIGIGVVSPANKLHVNGAVSIGSGSNSAAPTNGLIVGGNSIIGGTSSLTTGGTAGLSIINSGAALSIGNSNNDMSYIRRNGTAIFQWQTYNGTNAGEIHLQPYGGSIGIGTTAPAYLLDINGVTRFRDVVRFKNSAWNLSDDGQVRFWFDVSGRTYFGSGSGYEWRNSADAALMVLQNGGNLGIGTTSPATTLQIGQLTPTSATAGLQFGDDTGTRIYRSASNTLTMGGTFIATTFSGSGASLTNLPAGQLSGTIPSGVLGNSTVYIGTTAILLNRASASQSLTGITSIDGYSASSTRMGSWDGTTFNSGSNSLASSGGRAANLNPNTYQQSISFEFKNGSFSTISGNYAGLITIAPWLGTTASTGDPNYQLLFSPAAVNSTNPPVLQLRAGIDTTWGSWSTILHSSNYNSYAPTLTGTGASGNWAINVTGSAASATDANLLVSLDDRTIAPNEIGTARLRFGFTSWANNNTSPWADYLHLRSYSDSSGGNDNLVMFRKDAIGMRIYQAGFGTSVAYSSYKDVCWTDGTNATGTWSINTSGNAANVTGTVAVGNGGTGATSFTAGRILFGNATSAINTSGNLFWDNSNSRLGVGTATPSTQFHLEGGGANNIVSALTSFYGDGLFKVGTINGTSTNSSGEIIGKIGSYYNFGNLNSFIRFHRGGGATDGYMSFSTNSDVERVRIDANGNVGIGTTSPATTLQIGQLTPTSATAGLQFGDDTGTRIYRSASNTLTMGGTFIATTFSGSGASLTSLNASNLSSGTVPGDRGVTAGSATVSFVEYNGTTATAGQFDGGTTNPSATTRLNYGGYLYATRFYGDGSNLTGVTGSSFGSQTANTFFAAPNGSSGNPTFRAIVAADVPTLNQNTTGSAATLTTTRTLWGQNFNGSANVTGSLTSVGDITGSSAITITAGGSNQNVTITPSGTGYTLLNGNVGIGTSTPRSSLHVNTVNGSAANEYQGLVVSPTTSPSKGVNIAYDSTNDIGVIQPVHNGVAWKNLSLAPSGGSVGVGTLTPAYKLDVNGDINFVNTLKFNGVTVITNTSTDIYINSRVIQNNSTALQDGMYINYNSTGTTSAHLRFYANGTNERMRIDASNGNVGIGTTAPAVLLHIGGSSQTTAAYGLRFGLDTSANLYRSASATVRTDGSLTVGGTVTELSALKYKENISPLSNILNKLCYVQPVTYNKKGEDKKEYGVIAEEVAELFPELVSHNNDGELESVNYSRLTVLLIQAVKELKSEIDKLKKK